MNYSKILSALSVSILSISLSTMSIACGPSTQMTKARITKLFTWINQIGNLNKPLTLSDMDTYFAPSFQKFSDDKLIATDAQSLNARRAYDAKQYRSFAVQGPMKDEIIDDNKAALRFNLTVIDNSGKTIKFTDVMFITFNKEGKVSVMRDVLSQG